MMDGSGCGHVFLQSRGVDPNGFISKSLQPISLEFEGNWVDHLHVVSDSGEDIQPELIEQVDELLGQIEETAKAYTPEEERAVESGALLTDDGAVAEPAPETADQTEEPPTDSIESAQQALDAIEEIEQQAEGLVEESIDALLDSAEASSDAANETPEPAELDLESNEIEAAAVESTEEQAEESIPESTDTTDDTLEGAIDTLLEEESQDSGVDEELEAMLSPKTESETDQADEDPAESAQDSTQADDESASLDEIEAALTIENDTASSESIDDSMDLLDSALAEAADDMLEGDFETEDGELVSGDAVPSEMEAALQGAEQSPEPIADTTAADDVSVEDAVGEILDGDSVETAVEESVDSETETAAETENTPEATAEKVASTENENT